MDLGELGGDGRGELCSVVRVLVVNFFVISLAKVLVLLSTVTTVEVEVVIMGNLEMQI